jgi:toxin ParE1/3/4
MARFKLTNEAVKDLEEIWIYTYQNWSVEQADRYYNLIIDEIEFLSSNPLSGRSMDYIKEGYRVSKVKSHLVFYKIITNEAIEIIRILHQ